MPRRPTTRDFDIFDAVTIRGLSQRSAGLEFDLVQGQVSRICRRVANWIKTFPGEGFTSAENYLVRHKHRRRLEIELDAVRAAWKLSCERVVEEVQHPDGTLEKRIFKNPRPDPRLLRELRMASAELAAAEESELRAEQSAHARRQLEKRHAEHMQRMAEIRHHGTPALEDNPNANPPRA